jgi:uncharacterized membrane protein (UPF0127 family)
VIPIAAGCGRTEEPPSPQPRAAQDARATASHPDEYGSRPDAGAKRTSPRAAKPCVVPMAAEPPPVARPAQSCPADPVAMPRVLPTGEVVFVDAPDRPAASVEIVDDAPSRTRGLMYRTRLGENAGMLFVWPESRPRSFWMRNTCIPLDMLFIGPDDTIVGILEQVPTLNDDPRQNPCPANRVLELNAGWARAHGVRPGQRIEVFYHSPPKGAR